MSALSWADKLYGPTPPRQPPGMASFARFKRVTTGTNVAWAMWEERCRLAAALDPPPAHDEHRALVVYQEKGNWYPCCARRGCDFLGARHDVEADALTEAEAHAAGG